MGVIDAISGSMGGPSLTGGWNGITGQSDYQSVLPPTLGGPGATQDQIYQNYQRQNKGFQNQINAAQSQRLPENVLNFGANRGESAQQQQLIDQILAQGRGEGPNPAMDQLRLTTDQNARSAAGLIGSQHGVNPALAARMASQGLSNANQQAVGQGALMNSQQQLGAQQLGGQMLGQRIGQQSQDAIAQGQAGLGLMQQRGSLEAQRQQAQQNYQNMVNNVYSNANNVNSEISQQNATNTGNFWGGILSGASSAAAGGAGMYQGGEVNPFQTHINNKNISQSLSKILSQHFSQGGEVDGMAKIGGDSSTNDTVPAMLSPGEVVIPRTAMQNSESAHDFLDKIIRKNDGPAYKDILQAKNHYHNMAHGGEMSKCTYCGEMA